MTTDNVTTKPRTSITEVIETINDFQKTDKATYDSSTVLLMASIAQLKEDLIEERQQRFNRAVSANVFVPLEEI